MGVRGGRQMATMERVLVVVEDVLLVEFFFVDGHGWNSTNCGQLSSQFTTRVVEGQPAVIDCESPQRDSGGERDGGGFYAEDSLARARRIASRR